MTNETQANTPSERIREIAQEMAVQGVQDAARMAMKVLKEDEFQGAVMHAMSNPTIRVNAIVQYLDECYEYQKERALKVTL